MSEGKPLKLEAWLHWKRLQLERETDHDEIWESEKQFYEEIKQLVTLCRQMAKSLKALIENHDGAQTKNCFNEHCCASNMIAAEEGKKILESYRRAMGTKE